MSILRRIPRISLIATLAVACCTCFPETSRLQTAKPGGQTVPQDTLITLERTGCYGMCPIYKVSISADGAVVFEGNRFVKKVGSARSAISDEQIRELLVAFEKINYFELSDQYAKPEDGCKQWLTDHPSAITSITRNGKSKSVTHYYGCRGVDVLKELEKLEQAIDEAVNSAQWIR
jgi:uncharacterized protein DUF6438